MTKARVKFSIFIILSLIGLTAGFFFAGYLNLLLSGGSIDNLSAMRPANLLAGFMADERQRMLTFCMWLVIEAGIAVVILLSRKESFESETLDVTKGIKTPIAIGQGQHGTARWMTGAEKREAFSVYRMDRREMPYSKLINKGKQERKEVTEYDDEPKESIPAAEKSITENSGRNQEAESK